MINGRVLLLDYYIMLVLLKKTAEIMSHIHVVQYSVHYLRLPAPPLVRF